MSSQIAAEESPKIGTLERSKIDTAEQLIAIKTNIISFAPFLEPPNLEVRSWNISIRISRC